jgi:hypothetical protein
VLALREEQRQGEAGGGGIEQVRVEVGVANSEQRHDGNGLVRLELRGVAAGVPVAAWQLASEGVYARECARAHGCKQMHPVSSNDQTVAAQRGGGTILRTEEHGRERLAQRWFGWLPRVYAEGKPSTASSRRDGKGDDSTLHALDRG